MERKLLYGRYKIIQTLSGGMGNIYLCLDQHQDSFPVAIKTIKFDFLSNQESRNKFIHETNIWIELGWHPNIVHAYQIDYIPETHELFVVTELIRAPVSFSDSSLRSWQLAGRINMENALRFGLQVIRGMKHATDKFPDLVHRDLKPENILVGLDEIAKVNDFGLASTVMGGVLVNGELSQTTKNNKTHSAVGTLLYMSPEQCMAKPLDCRSDIYAFGLILFELLTGNFAVFGNNEHEIVASHLSGAAYQSIRDEINDDRFIALLQGCLHPDPEKRYTNWETLEIVFLKVFSSVLGKLPPVDEYPTDVSLLGFYQKVKSYLAIGAAYLDTGEYERAKEFTGKSLDMAQDIDALHIRAVALSNLGVILYQQGLYDQAIQHYSEAEKINFQLHDLVNQAINLGNIGGAHQKIGNVDIARDYFLKSLDIARREDMAGVQATQLGNLAISYLEQADFNRAIEYYQQAIDLLKEQGAEIALAINLGNMGNAFLLYGNTQNAEKNLNQAYQIAVSHGLLPLQSVFLGNMANVLIAKGDYDNALLRLLEAIQISEKNGDWGSLCQQLATAGSVLVQLTEYEKAIGYYEQALSISQEIMNLHSASSIFLGIGNLYVQVGDFAQAETALQKCIDVSRQIKNLHTEASALGNLGKLYAAIGKLDEAMQCLQNSNEIAITIGAEEIQGRASWTIGVIYEMLQNPVEAINYMQFAVKIFRKYDHPEYSQASLHMRDLFLRYKST
jgi:serine/threonine protein kinase